MSSINDYIDSINYSIDSMRSSQEEINKVDIDDLPSDFKLMMMGTDYKNSQIINFIFDNRLDKVIDNILNRLMTGNFDEIDKYSSMIKKVFELAGIGEGSFEGPVAQALMTNITNTLNSYKMYNTKNKVRKCLLILHNLKRKAKEIDDPVVRKKYLAAVHGFKQTLRFIAKVYKDRRIISNRVISELKIAIHEEYTFVDEELEFDFFE